MCLNIEVYQDQKQFLAVVVHYDSTGRNEIHDLEVKYFIREGKFYTDTLKYETSWWNMELNLEKMSQLIAFYAFPSYQKSIAMDKVKHFSKQGSSNSKILSIETLVKEM